MLRLALLLISAVFLMTQPAAADQVQFFPPQGPCTPDNPILAWNGTGGTYCTHLVFDDLPDCKDGQYLTKKNGEMKCLDLPGTTSSSNSGSSSSGSTAPAPGSTSSNTTTSKPAYNADGSPTGAPLSVAATGGSSTSVAAGGGNSTSLAAGGGNSTSVAARGGNSTSVAARGGNSSSVAANSRGTNYAPYYYNNASYYYPAYIDSPIYVDTPYVEPYVDYVPADDTPYYGGEPSYYGDGGGDGGSDYGAYEE